MVSPSQVLHGSRGTLVQSIPSRQTLPPPGPGHAGCGSQDPAPLQSVSHAHDCPHPTVPRHESEPAHETAHGPRPHWIRPGHERSPSQTTSHSEDRKQVTPPPHDRSPVHSTRHGIPTGHTVNPPHESGSVHSITQVCPSHEVHAFGHSKAASTAASGAGASGGGASGTAPSGRSPATQKPIEQTRPLAHSKSLAQANPSLRCSTWQAVTPATKRAAPATAIADIVIPRLKNALSR